MLFPVGGTDQMTGLLTTPGETGWNGDRCQTEYTLSGLGRRKKWIEHWTDLLCHTLLFFLADLGVNNGMGNGDGRRCFCREKRSRGRRERTNDQTEHGVSLGGGGKGLGDPLPPP